MRNLILNASQLVMGLTLMGVSSRRRALAINFYAYAVSCALALNQFTPKRKS
jgi:hypothetical protein